MLTSSSSSSRGNISTMGSLALTAMLCSMAHVMITLHVVAGRSCTISPVLCRHLYKGDVIKDIHPIDFGINGY